MHRPATCRACQFGDYLLIKKMSRSRTLQALDAYSSGLPQISKRYTISSMSKNNDRHQQIHAKDQLIWRKFSTLSKQNAICHDAKGSKNVYKLRNIGNGLGSSSRNTTHSEPHSLKVSNTSDYVRTFCRVTDSKVTALYLDGIFESGIGDEDPLTDLRNILYPEQLNALSENEEESDPLYLLSHASSVKDVLTTYSSIPRDSIQPHHTAQALSTLRHMQKLSVQAINYLDEDESRLSRIEYNRLLALEPIYVEMLQCLNHQFSEMNTDIAAYVFQCLRRLEQPLSSPVMVNLLVYLQKHLREMDARALSYFAIGISGRDSTVTKQYSVPWGANNLRKILCLAPAVGKLDVFINEMNTAEDVHQVAICISMMSTLVANSTLSTFYQRLNYIIDTGEFRYNIGASENKDASQASIQISALVKVLSIYLTKKDWHLNQAATIRKILYQLKGRFEELRPDQLVIVFRVAGDLGEPVSILYELDRTIRKLFEMQKLADIENSELYYLSENHANLDHQKLPSSSEQKVFNSPVIDNPRVNLRSYIPRVDFLLSMVNLKLGNVDINTTKELVKECMNGQLFGIYIGQIFEILRSTSIGNDEDLVNEFLERSYNVCQHDMLELCRLSTRYMNFNSVMGGIVRDPNFERKVIEDFEKDILTNPYPVEFAAQFGFLVSYSKYIAPEVFERFHCMLNQLRPFHLYAISRGLETRFQWVPQSIPADKRSKKVQRWQYNDGNKMKVMLDEVDVAISRHSLKLLSSIIKDTAVTETLPDIDTFDRKYLKLENMNDEKYSSYKTLHTYFQEFPNTFLIFKNFVSRRRYLDKQGFNKVIVCMVQYLEHTDLTFQVIRQITAALGNLKPPHDVSKLMGQIINYMLINRNHVHTHTLLRPLSLAFDSSSDVLQSVKGKPKFDEVVVLVKLSWSALYDPQLFWKFSI